MSPTRRDPQRTSSPAPGSTQGHSNSELMPESVIQTLLELWQLEAMTIALGSPCQCPNILWCRIFY